VFVIIVALLPFALMLVKAERTVMWITYFYWWWCY
jgi:hypothetical protein